MCPTLGQAVTAITAPLVTTTTTSDGATTLTTTTMTMTTTTTTRSADAFLCAYSNSLGCSACVQVSRALFVFLFLHK